MGEVGNDKRMVVGCLTLHPDTLAARTIGVQGGRCVHTHIDLITPLRLQQAQLLSLLRVDVFYESICGAC